MTWQMLCEQSWTFSPKPGMSSPELRREQSLVTTCMIHTMTKCQHVAGCAYKHGTFFLQLCFVLLFSVAYLREFDDDMHQHEPESLRRPSTHVVSSSTYFS